MKIGFVGLGIMGAQMAKNLLKAGFELQVFARNESVRMQFSTLDGCSIKPTITEVAQGADVVITMVSDTPDVEAVLFGPEGVIEGIKPGCIVVDMSTISPMATRNMANRIEASGGSMLDAPVSGGEAGAIAGTLSIMVGGKSEDFQSVLPLLEAMGKNIVHIGDHGAGQVAKACNQILAAVCIEGVAEALSLAEASGVDAAKVRSALLGGFAYSKVLEIHGLRMLEENYTPGFKAKLHQKDMQIVAQEAQQLGLKLPCTKAATEQIHVLVESGCGELDSSALRTLIRREVECSEA